MPIDPQLQTLLDALRAAGLPRFGSLTAAEMRASVPPNPPSGIEVGSTRDLEIPDGPRAIPARLYRPSSAPLGLIVYYHGGGWVFGDLDTADAALRRLTNATNCAVLSVDYRLAPEAPFPAAVDDALRALNWAAAERSQLTDRADAPLAVMGDSAGANLAAVVALLARDAGGPTLDLQVLVYPATEGDLESYSMSAFDPPFLTRDEIAWFYDQYIPADERADPRFAPGKAADHANLPPAIIVTAEYDLLTAEARLYGEKLRAAGGRVTLLDYEGAIHGFVTLAPMLDIGQRAILDISDCVRGEFVDIGATT